MKSFYIIGLGLISLMLFAFMNLNDAETKVSKRELADTVKCEPLTNNFGFGYAFTKELKRRNTPVSFIVKGKYSKSITKEKLIAATQISDIILDYPTQWIQDYSTVSITVKSNGVGVSAINSIAVLSKEQLDLIQSSDVNDEVYINVKYLLYNVITEKLENRDMHVYLTVIPEVEAVYTGGMDKVNSYLRDNCTDEVNLYLSKRINELQNSSSMDPVFSILFSVNESGKTEDLVLEISSGNEKIDKYLLELIDDMPNWNPAQNGMGKTVTQKFELLIGARGC